MKRFVAALAIGIIPLAVVAPARADNCQSTVIGSVCLPTVPLPGLPQVPGVPGPVAPVPIPGPVTAPVIPGPPNVAPQPQPNSPAPTAINRAPVVKSNPVQAQPEPVQVPQAAAVPTPDKTETNATTPHAPVASKPVVKTRVITVTQAVELSIGFLLLGGFLVLLALFVMYRIGKREGENSVNEFMSELMGLTVRSNSKNRKS